MKFRACWVTHSPVGLAVTPAMCTIRLLHSMSTSTYSRRSSTVSTETKSHATMPAAWARRKSRQLSEARRGAGDTPASWSTFHTVLGASLKPSRASSPCTRR
jgi:hypothetical protein